MKTVRDLYMKDILSHAEYYGFLAELIKPPVFHLLERVRKSTDPHLNDIPLCNWDRLDSTVRRAAVKSGAAAFNSDPPAWSLSDTVCVAKAYARHLAQKG